MLVVWLLLGWLGLTVVIYFVWRFGYRKVPSPATPILTCHSITCRWLPGVSRLHPAQFQRLLTFITDHGYRGVGLFQALDGQPSQKKIAVTFDDGYEDFYYVVFPLLQQFGFTATVFVVTGYTGQLSDWDINLFGKKNRHLSWQQIRELNQQGIEFGSHTVTHQDLTRLPLTQLRAELRKSKQTLEDRLGQKVLFISYPFGRYNLPVIQEAKNADYKAGFTNYPRLDLRSYDPFIIKRIGLTGFDSPLSLQFKLSTGGWRWIEEMKNLIVCRFALGTTLLQKRGGS